jgi:radical SAM protein with 4Fe4S-binding SPASM domain
MSEDLQMNPNRSISPMKRIRGLARKALKHIVTFLVAAGIIRRNNADRVVDSFRALIRNMGRPDVLRNYTPLSLITMPLEPSHFAIGLTGFCNLKCPFCPLTIMENAEGASSASVRYMQDETLIRCLDQAATLGISGVVFTFFGDALLHPRILDFIREAKQRNMQVSLHTNGNIMTQERARMLIESGIDKIFFSIDAMTPAVYTELRPGGNIERVKSNFQTLRNEIDKRNSSTRLGILCVAQPQYQDEWKRVLGELGAIADFAVVSDMGVWTEDDSAKPRYTSCKQPWSVIAIYPDGDVSLCCADAGKNLAIGNINNESLLNIWHGRKAQQIRSHLMRLRGASVPDICSTCRTLSNCPTMEEIRSILPAATEADRVTW